MDVKSMRLLKLLLTRLHAQKAKELSMFKLLVALPSSNATISGGGNDGNTQHVY